MTQEQNIDSNVPFIFPENTENVVVEIQPDEAEITIDKDTEAEKLNASVILLQLQIMNKVNDLLINSSKINSILKSVARMKNIKVNISEKVQNISLYPSLIGQVTTNGKNNLKQWSKDKALYYVTNFSEKAVKLLSEESDKINDLPLPKEKTNNDVVTITPEVQTIVPEPSMAPEAIKPIVVNEYKPVTGEEQTINEYKPITGEELPVEETKATIAEEHPDNVIDGIKTIAKNTKLSFQAMVLSGLVKNSNLNNFTLLNSKIPGTMSKEKDVVVIVVKDIPPKIKAAFSNLKSEKHTETLEEKINAYKQMLESNKERYEDIKNLPKMEAPPTFDETPQMTM